MVIKSKIQAPIVNDEENDKKVEEFITKSSNPKTRKKTHKLGHRMTLRLPKDLIDAIDQEIENRIGSISRNSLIVEKLAICFNLTSK
jgi:predicted DNA binding CopG/RHH family protein